MHITLAELKEMGKDCPRKEILVCPHKGPWEFVKWSGKMDEMVTPCAEEQATHKVCACRGIYDI